MTTQTMDHPGAQVHHRKVLRYRKQPRIVHLLLATSFLVLLASGLVLFLPVLSHLASGGTSRLLHRISAVAFMAVPIVYLIVDRPGAKELLWDSFHYDKDDGKWLLHIYRYFLGHAAEMPPQGRLNAGQKLHHAGIVIFSATIVISGLILWFAKGSMGPINLGIAAVFHDLSMLALTILLVGHLYFTYVYNALSGMTSGYIDADDAQLEHPKWVEELPKEDPWIVEE